MQITILCTYDLYNIIHQLYFKKKEKTKEKQGGDHKSRWKLTPEEGLGGEVMIKKGLESGMDIYTLPNVK